MITKIAVFDTKPFDEELFNRINKNFKFQITYFKEHLSSHNALLTKGYTVVCVFVNDIVDKECIDILYENGVRLIALRCAGYNNVDFVSAFKKIRVVRVPAYSPYAVAEHTVALMLALNRKTHKAYWRTKESNFSLNGLMGFDMHGKTAGIIGAGRIARVLIDILKGFGLNILAYDPHPDEKYATEKNIQFVSLNELFQQSDIISLHCPLMQDTEYLINKNTIALMKNGVMIINTGRGKLINTRDLIQGLKSGKVGYAGLDVYEEEGDYFFEDRSDVVLNDDTLARLLTFNNVIITSHQAFFTHEALHNITATTFGNIQAFLDGKPLENEICYRCDKLNKTCDVKNRKDCFSDKK